MTRTRASARQAGARFERAVADYLAEHVDDRIDRRVKTGAKGLARSAQRVLPSGDQQADLAQPLRQRLASVGSGSEESGLLVGCAADLHVGGAGVVDGGSSGAGRAHTAQVSAVQKVSAMGCVTRLPRSTVSRMTTGQQFAAALRTSFRINGKSRDRRNGGSIKADMLESVENAVQFEGYYGPERTALSRAAFGAVQSHRKHVEGYRVDGMVAYEISKMSPYQFAGYLGQMIDAGVTNTGQGEVFYSRMRQSVAA